MKRAGAAPIIDRAFALQEGRESEPSRTARARMAALLCLSNDPHKDALIRAALHQELQAHTGWARAIRRRLDKRAAALSEPPP